MEPRPYVATRHIWRMDPGSACLKAHIATEVYIIHECDSDKHLQYTSKIDLYVYKLLYNTCVHMKGVVGSLRCRSLRTREGLGFESWQWGTLRNVRRTIWETPIWCAAYRSNSE